MRISKRTRAIGVMLVLMSLLMVTCDDFMLSETFSRETDDPDSGNPDTALPLAIFPATAATWTSGSLEFIGQGGVPEYTFSVEGVGGGTIDAETGVYTAPPDAGEFTVTVTDQAGDSGLAVVYVVEERPLRISPRSASVALNADPPDFVEFTASGGEGSYEFSVLPGGTGAGTVVLTTGVFTPGDPGEVTINVTDGTSNVTASVFVYDNDGAGLQVIPDELEIAQGESTAIRIVPESGSYTVGPLQEGTDFDHLGMSLGSIVNLVEAPWKGQYIADDSIGEIEISADDNDSSAADSVIITVLPAIPIELMAENATGDPNSIRLSWKHSAPLPDDGGFRIFRSTSSGPMEQLTPEPPIGPNQREFLDEGVSPAAGRYYIYEIVAFTPNFTSRPSDPSPPTTSKP